MNKLFLPLSGILLATSALIAPQVAAAQATAAAQSQSGPRASSEDTQVEEVLILGKNIPEPMRTTSEVASFLTEEDIKRQGDSSAAEALTRISGLSLVSGRFIYVRGLGERYSSAMLNGSPLPSPEPLQRVVPLDLFPSSILAGATVQKSYSPNYPGEFGGGVIDLQTVAVPDEPFFQVEVGTSGNTETSLKKGLTYYGSDTDFLGYDDGARDKPAELRAALATGKRINSSNFTNAELTRIGQSLVNAPLNLIQRKNKIPLGFSADISAGQSFDLGWGHLGVVALGGFENDWRTRQGKQQEGLEQNGKLEPRTNYDFTATSNNVTVNGLLGLGLEWGENQIRWTNLYIHKTTKSARQRAGEDYLAGQTVLDSYTEWFERDLLDTQLAGKHQFGAWNFDWRASYAKSERDAPYEKFIRYRLDNGVYYHSASQEQNATSFSELNDTVASGGFDVQYTLPLSSGRDAVFSGGYAYMDNQRDAERRDFRYQGGAIPLTVQQERVDFLLSDYNIAQGYLTFTEITGGDGAAAYDAGLKVHAAYGQVDAELLPRLRTSLGVRVEDGKQRVQVVDLFGGAAASPTRLDETYVLPAATLTYNFYEDMQFRVGASKTIARPQFRELAPQQYFDADTDRLFIGNPYLKDTELLNFDARVEWYFAAGQYLSGGVFYKDLDRPVEAVVSEQGATIVQTYVNAPKATLHGFEVDFRKFFELPFEGPLFDGKRWMIGANYTYTNSDIKVSQGDVVFPLAGAGASRPASDYVKDGSQLQGMSEHLANIQFGYENVETRSQATILATYVSERISARGRPGQPDLVQDPGVTVDFTYRRAFDVKGRELEFTFKARNLLGEDYQEYQQLGGGRVDNNKYDLGQSFSVSLSTKF
jgi:TonB-dependent receptor